MYQLGSLGYRNLPFAILTKFFQLWAEFPLKVIKSCMGEKKHRQSWFKSLKKSRFLKLMSNYSFLFQRLQLKFLILQKNEVYTFKRLIVPQRISL